MTNTQYEKDREKHVKHIQDVFKSMGISILAKEVIDGLPKQAKLKGKELVSDNRDSDHDYDPSSDIDNQTDSDDSDDFEEVRCITSKLTSSWSIHFKHIL